MNSDNNYASLSPAPPASFTTNPQTGMVRPNMPPAQPLVVPQPPRTPKPIPDAATASLMASLPAHTGSDMGLGGKSPGVVPTSQTYPAIKTSEGAVPQG